MVVGSKGGHPDHPDWYKNLVANPEVELVVDDERRPMVARTASAEEKEQLWPDIVAFAPGNATGQVVNSPKLHLIVSAPFCPPGSLLKGIIVNEAGERFVAEDSYHGRIAGHVLDQPDAAAYLIVGADNVEWPALGLVPFIDGWDTIPDMAAELAIPTDALQHTITEHDLHAANGKDPAFGKHPDWLAPLGAGPYAAFDLTPGKATYVGFTLGGLRTSIDGEVITEAGDAIGGLYDAGACASNIAQDCLGYSSGTCLGEASLFGRRAGMHAVLPR